MLANSSGADGRESNDRVVVSYGGEQTGDAGERCQLRRTDAAFDVRPDLSRIAGLNVDWVRLPRIVFAEAEFLKTEWDCWDRLRAVQDVFPNLTSIRPVLPTDLPGGILLYMIEDEGKLNP